MKIATFIVYLRLLIIITSTQKSQAQCPNGYSQIIVNIIPDNYPNETSWDIRDTANNIVASGTINCDTLCYLTGQLLYFTIYDSYGDGIGYGSYSVYLDGNLVVSGGQFTTSQTTVFNYPPGIISAEIINTYQQLMNHCNNTAPLTPSQINALTDTIHKYHFYLAENLQEISAAFNLIDCYDTNTGPLFINPNYSLGIKF